MRKVWLLGLVAAAVLVVGPMAAAYAEEGAPPPKHERKAGAEGKGAGKQPELVVDPAKMELMKDKIKDLEDAIKALEAKAVEVLGPADGKRFVTQTITKSMRASRGAGKGEGRKERKPGEGRRGGADAPK
ncbi:MAG: hypothetical protein NTU94_04840 [Planctomycetota bacterium]|nr:hypothetical protein [Planctomycetota bacterium]